MTDTATKRCNKCGQVKPLSEFHRLASAPDGHQYTCKECKAEHAKENRPAARTSKQKYREKNRETIRAKGREYARDPEVRERARERYQENRDERIEQMRRGYQANRETRLEQGREYYQENLDVVRGRVRDRADRLRAQVFGHYGASCACCGRTDDLSIDHVDGNGHEHREEIFGRQGGGAEFYHWLIKHGFPEGYQTLCRPCNQSKFTGERCRLQH